MTAGELMLVVAGVLCTLAFAALAITLVRVRDALVSCVPTSRRSAPRRSDCWTDAQDGGGGAPRVGRRPR